jgi:cellulase (glycosyl hydrolase family 5)
VCASFSPLACSEAGGTSSLADSDGGPSPSGQNDASTHPLPAPDGPTPNVAADASVLSSVGDGGAPDRIADALTPKPPSDANSPSSDGGYPVGWLFTSGARIYVSNGSSGGTPWMGRGVNLDDIFLCGYDNTLWMMSPDQAMGTLVSGLMSGWKPNFVRISLSMDSYPTVTSWLSNAPQYKTPMTNVINAIGAHPNVHVLVTLRSDASMIGHDTVDGDPEATGLPSDRSTTPNAASFPTGTDATYVALVDTFANSSFVMFGLTNEPGGNKLSDATIAAAMSHAVGVIRAEENRLGVPHHLVSVQGNGWTGNIGFYATTPIAHDNVVYEVHGYPPPASSYSYSNIPVIIGEYGTLTSSTAAGFYADLEAKQIPNLAWDFESFSDCAPDLVKVTQSASNLTASSWGSIVQSYLLSHAP